MIEGMNHFTVLTDDLDRTLAFYVDLLGLEVGPRPDLGIPGKWLYAGDWPVLHVVAGRPRSELRSGVIDHMAFTARGLAATTEKLKAHGIEYRLGRQPESGTWQMFFHDPNGARVELDFDASE